MLASNPCLTCGACCAFLRVSFYWAEGDDATPGGVPVELTEKVDYFLRAMRGTHQKEIRCIALQGQIGKKVRCSIYERRPSVCRQFRPSWRDGIPNDQCDRARQSKGLPLLTPEDWLQAD